MKIELKKIGNSTGVILPKDLLARLDFRQGDWLDIVEGPGRTLRLAPYDPEHERMMDIARAVMREYEDTFRELAK